MSFKNKNKNNLNLTPRTHISVETLKNDHSNPNQIVNPKKIDRVDMGLKRLIFLGKIIKNYFPRKDNLLRRRALLEMKNSNSNKKMTPFQIYQKNKKLISMRIKRRINYEIKLKTVNSEKIFKKKNMFDINNSKRRINLKPINSQNKYHNTINCNFKNKLIKSVFEKSKNKSKTNLQYKTFHLTETNFNMSKTKNTKKYIKDKIKFRYLLSNENFFNNKDKILLNDLNYEKDKMILLNRHNILKKKKNINLFNEIRLTNNKTNTISLTEENKKNIYDNIPLIDLSNKNNANNNFANLIIKNYIKTSFFKGKKVQNNNL